MLVFKAEKILTMFLPFIAAKKNPFLFLVLFILLVLGALFGISKIRSNGGKLTSNYYRDNNSEALTRSPEISGWIAWWKEQQGYSLIQKFPGKIKTVSPVWFMIDKNLKLSDVGTIDRKQTVEKLKASNIEILPSLGSELTSEELSPLLNDQNKINSLIEDLNERLDLLNVDGIDIDLEGIKKEDRDTFSLFLSKMSGRLKKYNLKMSVTIHAQTGKVIWEGVEGQDLKRIGEIADEVRIMAYDEHSADTQPGSVASYSWISEIALYNSNLIDKDKIIIGVPSYGYIWTKNGDSQGLQFDEFNRYLQGKDYIQNRDKDSGEIIVNGKNFSGWLSDSEAMVTKIEHLKKLGFNKFIIWHLGGIDEKFFDKNWSE